MQDLKFCSYIAVLLPFFFKSILDCSYFSLNVEVNDIETDLLVVTGK